MRHPVRSSERLELLRLLVTSAEPLTSDEIAEALYGPGADGDLTMRVRSRICDLRDRLRAAFGLRRGSELYLRAFLAEPDGSRPRSAEVSAPFPENAEVAAEMGRRLGAELR